MKKIFEYGGVVAGAVLIVFGVIAIAMGVNGRSDVRDRLADQKITGTPDAAQITGGALQPGEAVNTGAKAKAFGAIMAYHALESTEARALAEQLALFGIVVGVALLLTGIGFVVLSLGGAIRFAPVAARRARRGAVPSPA